MKNVFNRIWFNLCSSLVLAAIWLLTQSSTLLAETSASPKKIGLLISLTGDFAPFGDQARKGAEIARDEIRQQGGNIELYFEDDKCLPGDAVSGFNKLKTINNVDLIIGPGCTGGIMSTGPIAKSSRTPQLALFDTNNEVKRAGDYTFSLGFPSEGEGQKAAEEIHRRGYTKVGVLYETDAWAMVVKEAFIKRFQELGGSITSDETQNPADKDWRSNITKLRSRKPDAVYIVPAYNGGPVLKQIKELGYQVQIFGPDTFGIQEVIDIGGAGAEGVIFTNVVIDEANNDAKNFTKKFEATFKEKPRTFFYCAMAYDAVRMAYQALQDPAGGYTGLKNVKLEHGLVGVSGFDAERMSNIPLGLWTIKDRKFVQIGK